MGILKTHNKIKEIRRDISLIAVWYTIASLTIFILETIFGLSSINNIINIILIIISFMFVSQFLFHIALYRMWEDIIEAIEELKNNKSKDG
jgi:hypothetical protein